MVSIHVQNSYTHFNGSRYESCILCGDSMMNPVETCVPVLIFKVLLSNANKWILSKQLQLSVIVSKLKLLNAFTHFHFIAGEAAKRVSVHLV